MTFIVFGAVIAVVIIGTAVWGIIIDGTLRRPPSEWVGSLYLGFFVGLIAVAFFFVDEIRSHASFAIPIALLIAVVIVWSTVVLWQRVKVWDEAYYSKHRAHKK